MWRGSGAKAGMRSGRGTVVEGHRATVREVLEWGRGGGCGTQKGLYQNWPDQIFPMVNFIFPVMVTLVWGGGDPDRTQRPDATCGGKNG